MTLLDTWLERVRVARDARRTYEAAWVKWYVGSVKSGRALKPPR